MASTTFKLRLGNQKKSINHERYRKETSLSDFIWNLTKQGKTYDLKWKQIGRAQPFSPISGECNLCTLEKFHLLFTPELATINKKEEINNYCQHKLPVLFKNIEFEVNPKKFQQNLAKEKETSWG